MLIDTVINTSKTKINVNYSQTFSSYLSVNTINLGYKANQLMLYGEIIAVCSEIHTKHKYTVWAERRIIYKDPVRTAQ